jgi:hypothetical protein
MPLSRPQSSLWLFGLLGIFSVLAWSTPKKKTLVKTIQPQDGTTDKHGDIARPVTAFHEQTIDAKSTKEKTYRPADWVKTTAILQAIAVPVALGLVWVTYLQTVAVTKTATTSEKQLEMGERPWIYSPDVPRATTPFLLNEKSPTLNFDIQVKNIGHSPAVGLIVIAKLYPVFNIRSIEDRKQLCEETMQKTALGNTVFPDEVQTWHNVGVGISSNQFLDMERAGLRVGQDFQTRLIVCTAYRAQFNDSIYYTGMIYEVSPAFKYEGDNVPADQVKVTIWPLANTETK